MKQLLTIFSFITTITFFISCSSDDGDSSVELNGGNILKYQVVRVELPNTPLNNAEYNGTLAGNPVTLETEGKTLVFLVDPSATTGNADLIVEDLNVTVHYNVQDVILPGTAEAVMTDFFQNENTVLSSLGTSTEENNLAQSLNNTTFVYNGLTADEKLLEAKIYFANKELFDLAMLSYLEIGNKTATQSNKQLLQNFVTYHRTLFGVGLIPRFLPTLKLYAVRKAIEVNELGLKRTFTRAINAKIMVEDIEVNNSSIPTLVDRKVKTLPITITERNLIESDGANASVDIQNFFTEVNLYNQRVAQINSFLDLFPDNWFDSLNTFDVPTTSDFYERNFDETDKNFTIFTALATNGDTVNLISALVNTAGQLNTSVSITSDNAMSFPLQAKLYYDFNDGISTKEGNLNINVMPRVNGTWQLSKFEETYSPGQWVNRYSSECPNIITGQFTINSKSIVISDAGTYSSTENWTNKSFGLTWSSCVVTDNGPDITTQGTDNESGTYTFNEDSYTGTTSAGQSYGINFITRNKVKVGDETYIRF